MEQRFFKIMESSPVIAAVKDEEDLQVCCQREELRVVFILFGNICCIGSIVERLKAAGKLVFVHTDLVHGLVGKEISADFIKAQTLADGIISTKPGIIRRANELGLHTILRVFLLDSMAISNLPNQVAQGKPEMVELLPGLMPKMIRKVHSTLRIPVIAGGLISDKEDVMEALGAGAISVSSTNHKVWSM